MSQCALTQIGGIASILIIVRIGLGIDVLSTSQIYPSLTVAITDVENQTPGAVITEDLEQSTAANSCFTLRPYEVVEGVKPCIQNSVDHSSDSILK
ncbi:hypothetical protein J3R30DRAFT_555759 [Lentinula aciculospora]|uniref:Uncharacterized protein n=1 Tax=Lentinula aciculospora TaxID=153920 RepID=A0A9W9A7L4_9AGAR|nr:hypothetical protein J3R30DRAFT_555759 [Lentinula aciculospora]